MVGILIALIVSWILLYLLERKNILALGFLPPLRRLKQFLVGFLLTSILCFSVQYLELVLKSSKWNLNENITPSMVINMFWWDFKSVVTEELVFRGALLFILIKKIGKNRGVLISAIAFGIYHWFSFGIFGNIIPMIFVFIGTGLMGYAWALAFSKTKSIFMAVGFHLGWNFTFNSIFSKGPLGQGVLLTKGGQSISDWYSLIGLILVPIFILVFVQYFIQDENQEFTKNVKITTANYT